MKKLKILLATMGALVLIAISVLGTVAYLTSQDAAVNTFTVGKVGIVLDETAVTPDGRPTGTDRVKENTYHLVPGMTYVKDPTITILKGSEESYVRMLVTVNCLKELDEIFSSNGVNLAAVFHGYDAENWIFETSVRDESANTITYEFRYKETVKPIGDSDMVLDALFDSMTVPETLGSDEMEALSDLKITVIGHAIQAHGFDHDDAAWSAFAVAING